MNATIQYAEQNRKDIEHHAERIKWLENGNPCYSCGKPVPNSVRDELIKQSRRVLERPCLGHNSAQ
jgi:hypothetical protein